MCKKSITALGENRIVDMLTKRFSARSHALVKGIGDDAAVIRPAGATERWAITTDMLLEDVDFRRGWLTPWQLGWKSLAANLSDLAAMGVRPRFYTVSLALPSDIAGNWISSFYRGLQSLGGKQGAVLIGGDLSSSPHGIQITITAIGESLRRKIVYRSGGKVRDRIYVTGILGRAAAGLMLLEKGVMEGRTPAERQALKAHRRPIPRCRVGEWLAQRGFARAMLDLSDGISKDLPRLCRASRTGARILASHMPCFLPAADWGFDPLQLAFHGGEDFELLFCVPRNKAVQMESAWPSDFPAITCIGSLDLMPDVVWMEAPSATPRPLPESGYDHFESR